MPSKLLLGVMLLVVLAFSSSSAISRDAKVVQSVWGNEITVAKYGLPFACYTHSPLSLRCDPSSLFLNLACWASLGFALLVAAAAIDGSRMRHVVACTAILLLLLCGFAVVPIGPVDSFFGLG